MLYFYPFDKSNVSFIRHCNFLTNAVLKDETEVPQYHIYLSMVKNVTMRGNYFENSVPITTYSGINRGNGVGGMISGFKVQDNPASFGAIATGTTGDPNTFIGLYYGVYGSQGPLSSDNIVVDGNVFTNNIRSVYLGNALLVYANRNTITMNLLANYGMALSRRCDESSPCRSLRASLRARG